MRGIVIACPEKYELICLNNIYLLRERYHCYLPIEIWEIDNEITAETKARMELAKVTFKNVADYTKDTAHWKGFQVKVFALYHSSFTEAILCDADMTFFQNPEIIFQDENYQKTGTYFFRDLDGWVFRDLRDDTTTNDSSTTNDNSISKFNSLTFYNKRQAFIKKCVPTQTPLFPKEWAYLYAPVPPRQPVKEALQESGVVYFDKSRLRESLEYIFKLNENHAETYEYVWGDKETFWLGCTMANQSYYFNSTAGFRYNGSLSHAYQNQLFWKQK
jgi:hypothetical protein